MDRETAAQCIAGGRAILGIELGSTRIKAVLIDEAYRVIATGGHTWENSLAGGLWTYPLEEALEGLRASYAALAGEVRGALGLKIERLRAVGISGMMHGYLPLDARGRQLAPFLTWRNTNTTEAAARLTELFGFNIPLRWSIAHLYRAVLDREAHVDRIAQISTLAGYIHRLLGGDPAVGFCEASGIFPLNSAAGDYDAAMLEKFSDLDEVRRLPWNIRDILPKALPAGVPAGRLSEQGAGMLDPSGTLRPGALLAPPEGDAGTGMTATNAVGAGTGNVSAGTSIFSMVVLKKPLSRLYRDIDLVATPGGLPVAMVHSNNGTSEIDAWVTVTRDILARCGLRAETSAVYDAIYHASLEGEKACGGLLAYNCLAAEPLTQIEEGRPLTLRGADSVPSLANLARAHIFGALAPLAIGMRILKDERVAISRLTCHGGLFKTPGVAQRYLAAAVNAPVSVLGHAGEGGPYGMALLAAYMTDRREGESLEAFLDQRIFDKEEGETLDADPGDAAGFARYLEQYEKGLKAVRAAGETFREAAPPSGPKAG